MDNDRREIKEHARNLIWMWDKLLSDQDTVEQGFRFRQVCGLDG